MDDRVWQRKAARDVRIGDRIIRNVEPGLEWVPGPYGAWIVSGILWKQDEVVLALAPLSGVGETIELGYDGDEIVVAVG